MGKIAGAAYEELRDLVRSPSNRGWLAARLDMGLSPQEAADQFGGDPLQRERAAYREMLLAGMGGRHGTRGTE